MDQEVKLKLEKRNGKWLDYLGMGKIFKRFGGCFLSLSLSLMTARKEMVEILPYLL